MEMHARTSDIGHSHAYICMAADTGQILFIRLGDPDTSVAHSNTLESEIVFAVHVHGNSHTRRGALCDTSHKNVSLD
jgi:hypothetical protein